MASWYKASIAYQKENEAGKLLWIKEDHLFDAVSFTTAETAAYGQIVTGASEFHVRRITPYKLSDLFSHEDGDIWFRGKIVYFLENERTGKPKKVTIYVLVNASDAAQALDRLNEGMRNWLIPYEIHDVIQTNILDVFPYKGKDDEPEIPANMRPLADVMAERAEQEAADRKTEAGEILD